MPSYGRNIESFAIDPTEKWIFAGNVFGQLLAIDADTFEIKNELDAHLGLVLAVEVHPRLPYVAALSVDHTVSLWRYDAGARLERISTVRLRGVRAENDFGYEPVQTLSQALAFHPAERRLLTRTAAGGIMELAFDDRGHELLWARIPFYGEDTVYDPSYVRYLEGSENIFCTAVQGMTMVLDPKRRDEPLLEYHPSDETIHAAEHIEGSIYLLPSDSRCVIRYDMSGEQAPLVGPKVTRDHLERVDYNRVSKRAFISSFDRRIQEISPETCESLGVVAVTPFKCRWLKTLNRDPSTMIVQCRNGALYRFDLAAKKTTGAIKETPNALWSSVSSRDKIFIAGDGAEMLELGISGADPETRATRFESKWIDLGCDPGVYTKRIIRHAPTGRLILGRTDGKILIHDQRTVELCDLGSPLRDLAAAPEGFTLFAVTEDGKAHKLDLETGKTLACFESPENEPFWTLAYNHERGLLGVLERIGSLHVLDVDDMTSVSETKGVANPKRAKWFDDHRLWMAIGFDIYELDIDTGVMSRIIANRGNTIEDFAWDEERRYLGLVTYYKDLSVFDLPTLEHLSTTQIDMHYPKGLEWMPIDRPGGGYRYELIVYGRSGIPRLFRLHDERLSALGEVRAGYSKVDPYAGVYAL